MDVSEVSDILSLRRRCERGGGGVRFMVEFAGKTWTKVNMMHTYTILQPLRKFTPSLSLGGVNAPYVRVR